MVSVAHSGLEISCKHSWNFSALFMDGSGDAWDDGALQSNAGDTFLKKRSSLFSASAFLPPLPPSCLAQCFRTRSENLLIYQASPLSNLALNFPNTKGSRRAGLQASKSNIQEHGVLTCQRRPEAWWS